MGCTRVCEPECVRATWRGSRGAEALGLDTSPLPEFSGPAGHRSWLPPASASQACRQGGGVVTLTQGPPPLRVLLLEAPSRAAHSQPCWAGAAAWTPLHPLQRQHSAPRPQGCIHPGRVPFMGWKKSWTRPNDLNNKYTELQADGRSLTVYTPRLCCLPL